MTTPTEMTYVYLVQSLEDNKVIAVFPTEDEAVAYTDKLRCAADLTEVYIVSRPLGEPKDRVNKWISLYH